jgi:preprotein translocase subunit SecG
MYELFLVLYLIIAAALIFLVLIQHGKGADMGASFGAGASATIFGSSGTGNFLTRSTTILAILFFILSLILGNYNTSHIEKKSEFENLAPVAEAVKTTDSPAAQVPAASDTKSTEATATKAEEAKSNDPAANVPVGN